MPYNIGRRQIRGRLNPYRANSQFRAGSAAMRIQAAFRKRKTAARIVARAPPVQRAKAVKSIQRAKTTNFNKRVSKVINKKAETFHQYGRAIYSAPLSAPIFQNASYHLFNLTGSAPLTAQTLVPQQLLGLTPEAYQSIAPTFIQGGYSGSNVYGKHIFSTMKITMPLYGPEQITPPLEGNQSQYFAQNWNIRFIVFKSKPFPSTSTIAGGQMLPPITNIFKSYVDSNFGPGTPSTEAPTDSITGAQFWTSDDLQWSKFNSTNYTKLLEKRFKLSMPEFIAYDTNRQDPASPNTTPYVAMAGGKKYPSEKTIHFNHKIQKKLQYAIENELPPDVRSFPLNYNNTIMCMVCVSPVGGTTDVQDTGMNQFIANAVKLDVQSTFTYNDM